MVNGNSAEKREVNMRKNRPQTTDHRPQIIDLYRKKNSLESGVWSLKSEKGIVLVVALLLLLVATVVGITALSTSTTNVMIAGNQRLQEICFSAADSGVSVVDPIINDTAYGHGAVSAAYNAVSNPLVQNVVDFDNEITGALKMNGDTPLASPDIRFTLGSGVTAVTVSVDVDYLYSAAEAGCAIEFASGYEGMGKSCSAGCCITYYDETSVAQCALGAESRVCTLYKYVNK
jgi:Tfp pilus assembly protein PilX